MLDCWEVDYTLLHCSALYGEKKNENVSTGCLDVIHFLESDKLNYEDHLKVRSLRCREQPSSYLTGSN